jgi:hypothetical protein
MFRVRRPRVVVWAARRTSPPSTPGPYLSLKLMQNAATYLMASAKHLPLGWVGAEHKVSGGKCFRHERAGPAVVPQLFCALLP